MGNLKKPNKLMEKEIRFVTTFREVGWRNCLKVVKR